MPGPFDSFLTPPLVDAAWWQGKRVVITGGTGFVGSHVVERLLPCCGRIVVPTRQATVGSNLSVIGKDVEIVRGDLRDEVFATSVCHRADVVIMLAATVGGIQYTSAHHASVFRDNFRIYLATMEAARAASVQRIVVTSSPCIYPTTKTIPTPEEVGNEGQPEAANRGYGWEKRMEEYLGSAYQDEYGMSVAVVRPSNGYGPRDDFRPDSSHVIPALVRKAFDPTSDTMTVWGSGRQTRSFIYVTDFADGLIRICERCDDAGATNLCSPEETTIGDIARRVLECAGTNKTIEFDTSRPEGHIRRCADGQRLKTKFDFVPAVSLNEGLAQTVEYFRQMEMTCAWN